MVRSKRDFGLCRAHAPVNECRRPNTAANGLIRFPRIANSGSLQPKVAPGEVSPRIQPRRMVGQFLKGLWWMAREGARDGSRSQATAVMHR
jgi:hypothetical protein